MIRMSSNFTKVNQKSPPKNASPHLIERSEGSDSKLNNGHKDKVATTRQEDEPEAGIGREEFKDIRDFLKNRRIRKKTTRNKGEGSTPCLNKSTAEFSARSSAEKFESFSAKNSRQGNSHLAPSNINEKDLETLSSKRSRKELLEALRKKNHQKTDPDIHLSPKNTMNEPACQANENMNIVIADGSTESDSSVSNRSPRRTDPFVIVHKDPSSRRCKPITELRELPDLHYEYVRHLANSLDYKKPKHEMEKCKKPFECYSFIYCM